jgi:hypothetical protein
VERIDVIRGGTQGIDMQGQAVVANVVRKKADSTSIVVDLTNDFWTDGHMMPDASVQLTASHRRESTYEFAVRDLEQFRRFRRHGFYRRHRCGAATVQHYDMH